MTELVAEQVVATERALKRVAEVLRDEAPGSFLRISVNGGGCSGFQYSFDIVPAAEEGDIILGDSESRLALDPVSLDYIKGARIDFVDDLMGSSFRIENPTPRRRAAAGQASPI